MKIADIDRLYTDYPYCAEALGLQYGVSDDCVISREGSTEEGFDYHNRGGSPLSSQRICEIEALSLPPTWTDVYYSCSSDSHLQAVAVDQQGSSQYIYHDRWTNFRTLINQLHLVVFAASLPKIRAWYEPRLSLSHGDAELAALLYIVDRTGIRPGNPTSNTSGLTTLSPDTLTFDESGLHIDIVGKSEQELSYDLFDPSVIAIVKDIYHTGKFVFSSSASSVNSLLSQITGSTITLKNFRTRRVNSHAVETMWNDEPTTIKAFIDYVVEYSQNTPAVAQSSYVYDGLTSLVRENCISDFKKKYKYTKPTSFLSSYEHVLFKYLQDELCSFSLKNP